MKGGENMKNMNICIDIDGTVTQPYFWLTEANKYFNRDVKPEDIAAYEIDKVMRVGRSDYDDFYWDLGESMHSGSEMRPDANQTIARLSELHRIHFVTARPKEMKEVSIDWLQKYEIPMNSISLLGSHYKAGVAKKLQCDLFIEDSMDNATELSKAGFDVLLIDCAYNKGFLPRGVTRVKDWYEIEMIVQARSKEKAKLKMAM